MHRHPSHFVAPRAGRFTRRWWSAVSMCLGLVCLSEHASSVYSAEALHWRQEAVGRSAPLPVPERGHAGFTLLGPESTGLNFTNTLSPAHAAENQIRLNGSGVAAGDVDGDGWCDLYFCGLEHGNHLFRNLGNWRFEDITESAGVGCPNQYSTGAVLADVDGDGDLDLLVNGIGVGTRLFLSDGKGHFTESASSGLVTRFGSTSMALADIDGDGTLDLYVANYRTSTIRSTGFAVYNLNGKRFIRPEDRDRLEYTPQGLILENGEVDVLYLNDGHGHFTPLSWTDGRFQESDGTPLRKPPRDWALTVAFRDLNGDHAPDIYVANDFQSPDRMWINDGHGHFRAPDPLAIRHTPTFSMAVDFADLDRDGADDFLSLDMLERSRARQMENLAMDPPNPPAIGEGDDRPQIDRNTLQRNRGDGTYAEIAEYAGLEATGWAWSLIFLDVDLDGYEDVLFSTGNLFNTQDLDANARIMAHGPFRREQIPSKLLMYPPLLQPKLAFRNRHDLTFEEVGEQWGFHESGVSHGMALADLDNDGDLDLVVNNLNAPAGLYRNESNAARIAVRLRGQAPNTRGIGAKIYVMGGPVTQSQEMIAGGRYLSGDDAMRVFAAGTSTNDLTVRVAWRGGQETVLAHARPNRVYEIEEPARSTQPSASPSGRMPAPAPLFSEVSSLLNHTHAEEMFDDYARQPLLPRKLSQLGPGVAWWDLDGDGWDDLLIASGRGGALAAFRNDQHGAFQRLTGPPFDQPVTRDQTGVIGWRNHSGAPVLLVGSANYEDGLALGSCVRQYDLAAKKVLDTFPGQLSSTGPLALADMDGDGGLDLFVGGRVIGGQYPQKASSLLFRNIGDTWELNEEDSRALQPVGLVSGAIWSDLDGDGLPELILACEWGPVRIFSKRGGALHEVTKDWGLEKALGWWNGVAAGDFDGDGRMDLVVSNWGLNTPCRASFAAPHRLYYADFDGNGTLDLVEASIEPASGHWFPDRDFDSLATAMPFLRERFSSHKDFASATLADVLGEKFTGAQILEVNTLDSIVLLNRGNHFDRIPLPSEAQFAPAFALAVADFDGDGREDVFLSQNFFATNPRVPREDAGRGLLLLGDGTGHFRAVPGQESGLRIYGEQRGAAAADYDQDGRVDLVVTENGAPTKLFHNAKAHPGLLVRLKGPPSNPEGLGSVVRLRFGGHSGPSREIHAGAGYWSEDSSVQVLALPEEPKEVEVRWPGGKTTIAPIRPDSREVIAAIDGSLTRVR